MHQILMRRDYESLGQTGLIRHKHQVNLLTMSYVIQQYVETSNTLRQACFFNFILFYDKTLCLVVIRLVGFVPTSPRAGSKRQSPEHQSTSDASGINEMLGVVARNIGKDWKQLGTSLGIKAAQIDTYPIDHPNDVREQIYQMLCDWVWKQTSQKEAEDVLIETLLKLGRADIVQELPG